MITIKSRNELIVEGSLEGKHIPFYDRITGDVICQTCGIVLQERIEEKTPLNIYSAEEFQRKVHYYPILDQDNRGLGRTTYYWQQTQLKMGDHLRSVFYRLDRHLSSDRPNRRWKTIHTIIEHICGNAELPALIIDSAENLFRKFLQKKPNLIGFSLDTFVAAFVWLACKQNKLLCSIQTFTETIQMPFWRIAYIIWKYISPHIPTVKITHPIPIWQSLGLYLPQLHQDPEFEMQVQQLLQKAEQKRVTMGKNPRVVIAAAIYYIIKHNQLRISQAQIATICDVSEVSLRTNQKLFRPFC